MVIGILTRMPTFHDFPARGRVIKVDGQRVVFHPVNTTYNMHLGVAAGAMLPADVPVEALVRVRARKVWTVPSGGLFVAPIVGPPKIVQGRVKHLDEEYVVLDAGLHVVVELPNDGAAYDLARGPVEVGALVNVTVLPGATFAMVKDAQPARAGRAAKTV